MSTSSRFFILPCLHVLKGQSLWVEHLWLVDPHEPHMLASLLSALSFVLLPLLPLLCFSSQSSAVSPSYVSRPCFGVHCECSFMHSHLFQLYPPLFYWSCLLPLQLSLSPHVITFRGFSNSIKHKQFYTLRQLGDPVVTNTKLM